MLSAGAALALGSLALVGAQILHPQEARFVAGAQAALAPIERKIELMRERLMLDRTLPEWGRLAEVLRANARRLEDGLARRAWQRDATAVEAMRAKAEMASLRAQALRDMLPALQSLYAVMQPHQRLAADRVFRGALRAAVEGTPG